jgi:hypothetical protein
MEIHMSGLFALKGSSTVKIVAAALVGAAGGLVGTAVVLGSLEFGIFGAVGGAVVSMIGALTQLEPAEA